MSLVSSICLGSTTPSTKLEEDPVKVAALAVLDANADEERRSSLDEDIITWLLLTAATAVEAA